MRNLTLGLAAALLAPILMTSGDTTPAHANPWPYCLQGTAEGSTRCDFANLEQCMATSSGVGGDCTINPTYRSNRDGAYAQYGSRRVPDQTY